MGSPAAKVTVVEYASASCPHCARFNNEALQAFKKKYVDTGKVRYVYREFLTDPIPFAATGFLLARCDGGSKYFTILDAIYKQQEDIYKSGDYIGGLKKIAAKNGIGDKQFADCTSDTNALNALNARVQAADRAGISGTPTFVVGDKTLNGEQTLDSLSAAIDPQLAKAG